jgi:predicted lipid-binding transport protein (Tim44 family)
VLVGTLVLLGLGLIVVAGLARRRPAPSAVGAPVARAPVPVPAPVPPDTDLDRGVRDIRRRDRGFDPARFAGYAGMMLRDVQSARVARDASGLRERLTAAMYAEFQVRCDRLRASGRSARVAEVDVTPEVTEAWQEGDRDYVTAHVAGSMLSHTIDDATGKLVEGSPTVPRPVAAFLTFTRPAGLNFWKLSLIQEDAAAARS